MGGDVKVLVVGENADQLQRWSIWLEQAGWTAVMCPGPNLTWGCPRADGLPCPRRELADVAVVALSDDERKEERLCTKVPDDGTTVFLKDGDVSLRVREKGIQVSERAPGVLIEAVRDALRSRQATRGLLT